MPRAILEHNSVFTLTVELTGSEVDVLKGMLQNPLFDQTPEDEPADQRAIRRAIFEACARLRL